MPHHSQCEPSSPLPKDDTGLSIGNCTSSIFLNTFALSKARARLIMCMSRVGRHLEVFYVANIPTCEFACSFLILNLLSFSPSLPPLLFAFYIVVAAQSSPSHLLLARGERNLWVENVNIYLIGVLVTTQGLTLSL